MTGSAARAWAWRGAFVLACLLQLYGLYAPRQPGPPGLPHVDKVAHCAIFALVAYFGLRVRVPARPLLGVLVVHAVVSEFVQHSLLSHRSGDPFDTLADVIGIAAGAWLGFRAVRGAKVAEHDMMGT